MSNAFKLSLAPQQLFQAINPLSLYLPNAQAGLINIDLGQTPEPETEYAILDKVASYGRQLGRIGDVLEVLIKHVDLGRLTQDEKDVLAIFQGQQAEIRQVKSA